MSFILFASSRQYFLFIIYLCRSEAALTYGEAQDRIDDKSKNDEITKGLRRLNKLAKKLKQKRIDNGYVDHVLQYKINAR